MTSVQICIIFGGGKSPDNDIRGENPDSGHSIEAFFDRLQDLCREDLSCSGIDRGSLATREAECAVALARKNGLLVESDETWDEFCASDECPEFVGTEHAVEFDESLDRVAKITIPPKFGLVPTLQRHRIFDIRQEFETPRFREVIEFDRGTPLEYLERCLCANEVFDDDIRLMSVVLWPDGEVSFATSQPHYNGEPASREVIEEFFIRDGWVRLRNEKELTVFFNYAFNVLAVDALPRNCYLNEDGLQPFDVILCRPDDELEEFLEIYPG